MVVFPFTDQIGAKKRPAVVIHSRGYAKEHRNLILMAVTTQPKPLGIFGETPITQWQRAGLKAPSVVKPVIGTFDEHLIQRKLGRLTDKDIQGLRSALTEILG